MTNTENTDIYLILAFQTVHDWAICFQKVVYCGPSAEDAKDHLTQAKEQYDHIETQVWRNNQQIRRNLHSDNEHINNLIANNS